MNWSAHGLMGRRPDVVTPHAYALARTGRQREARAMLDQLRRFSKPRDPAPFRLAMIHIGLGETDRAFEWLEKALQARDSAQRRAGLRRPSVGSTICCACRARRASNRKTQKAPLLNRVRVKRREFRLKVFRSVAHNGCVECPLEQISRSSSAS